METKTQDLLNQLQDNTCDLGTFLENNEDAFVETDIKSLWEKLIAKSGFSKSDIINKSEISYAFFYDIINDRKTPSRDKVLRLILAMQLSFEDCQMLLKSLQKAPLYARDRRDSIILFALEHRLSVNETLELLLEKNEDPLR